jgi:hypothetical protein
MLRVALPLLIAAAIPDGQYNSDAPVNVLTVCEVIANLDRYSNTNVAVVGHMERKVGVIDHYEFLSQDGCEPRILTNKHLWPNRILIWTIAEPGLPNPPEDKPKLENAVLAAKLAAVRNTTRLGTHKEPRPDGPGTSVVKNTWGVVYGRVVRSPLLDKYCAPKGCGGHDAPVILMAAPDAVQTLAVDGSTSSALKPLSRD